MLFLTIRDIVPQLTQLPFIFIQIYEQALKEGDSDHLDLDPPKQPRVRKSNRQIELDMGHSGAHESEQETHRQQWRKRFFELLDNLILRMKETFNRKELGVLGDIEELLVGAVKEEELENTTMVRLDNVYTFYRQDLSSRSDLEFELKALRRILKDKDCSSPSKFLNGFCAMSPELRQLVPSLTTLVKLLLVVGISGASAERSFSVLRRLKTYLRSTMTQKRLTHLSTLCIEKERAENIDTRDILSQFVKNDVREKKFGHILK